MRHIVHIRIITNNGLVHGALELQNLGTGGPIDSEKILVFEDAPAGAGAAKNAGMSVVMVPGPRLDSSHHAIADQVLSSLMDFNPSEWGLPAFENAKT
ncbi:hypothetical protein J1N35_019956 [Gossypium stocksii]|uniref:Uncharacterized protein n=1 Tax=Gossypium stocksii TaxID=47602 RepID=A0A9D3VBI8_9ROSI|nr:hypothetical protein J1N35_019956 [Gossypium stocksii]